jgi:MFS family permease
VRVVGLGFFAVVVCNGVDDVALVFLPAESLGGRPSDAGLLLAAVGVGLFAGYALVARAQRVGMVTLLIAGFAVSSAGNLLTGLAWAVAAAFTVQAVRGIGIAALDVAVNTIIQRTVRPDLLGRVFGSLYGAVGVAAAVSYVGGGLLLDATSASLTLVIAGAGGLIVTAVVSLALAGQEVGAAEGASAGDG